MICSSLLSEFAAAAYTLATGGQGVSILLTTAGIGMLSYGVWDHASRTISHWPCRRHDQPVPGQSGPAG
jgi:hypothetical protein